MLYYIFTYFEQWGLPGARLMHYVSFRLAIAIILSLSLSTLFGNAFISWLQKMQIGETIRDLDLEGQYSKKGTPTMGGLMIIFSIVIPSLLLTRLDNIYIILMLVTVVLMGGVGFLDDYIKVFKKNKNGLSGKKKIFGQVLLGLIVGITICFYPKTVIRENIEQPHQLGDNVKVRFQPKEVKSTKTTIPFFKNNNMDYMSLIPGKGKWSVLWGQILFIFITILIVTYTSNSVNLTDGLDGLSSGLSAITCVVLAIFAYVSSHIEFASYLNIMFIPGAEELVVFAGAVIGATIGFLWWNSYPAQIFMGDTGSLTLGGIIGVMAVLIRKELLLPIMCGVFYIESLSVVIQVVYFKYTKGGRVFKMTPLHHHFQKPAGVVNALIQAPKNKIPESKITIRFWLIGILLAAITFVTLKMR